MIKEDAPVNNMGDGQIADPKNRRLGDVRGQKIRNIDLLRRWVKGVKLDDGVS